MAGWVTAAVLVWNEWAYASEVVASLLARIHVMRVSRMDEFGWVGLDSANELAGDPFFGMRSRIDATAVQAAVLALGCFFREHGIDLFPGIAEVVAPT